MTCAEIAERGLIAGYVAGTLSQADLETLEAHLVDCPHCQAEVRLAVAVRGAVRQPATAAARPRTGLGLAVAGLALAAGIAGVLLLRPGSRNNRWKDLGAVTVAPIYLGIEVRGTPAKADSLFAAAMTAYREARYDVAGAGLRSALAANAEPAPAAFFMGAALLMQDKAGDAERAFARVIALGDTPYQGEARLYRAKALLRLGRPADAVTELRAVTSPATEVTAWARALADSVEGRLRR